MSGKLSTLHKQRVRYSPMLKPIANGTRCVAIDPKLESSNPELFNSLMQFAKANGLPFANPIKSPSNSVNQAMNETVFTSGKPYFDYLIAIDSARYSLT